MTEKESVIYVDNNATTSIAPEVRDAMLPYLGELYGNPSSMHTFGGKIKKDIENARGKIAELLGATPQEIVVMGSGTESDNAAIRGTLESVPQKKHFITTKVEHPAVLNVGKYLERHGYDVTYLGVDPDGNLDPDELRSSMRKDTALVSSMWAHNDV